MPFLLMGAVLGFYQCLTIFPFSSQYMQPFFFQKKQLEEKKNQKVDVHFTDGEFQREFQPKV